MTLPGYSGDVSIVSYQTPVCIKTGNGTSSFNTSDFCVQAGQLRVLVGNQCEIGGTYQFRFKTDCMTVGTATNNCTEGTLLADAFVGTALPNETLSLDICSAIFNTISPVTASIQPSRPMGEYQFGDRMGFEARLTSPDLPIYESRLVLLTLGRRSVQRSPAVGTATQIARNHNTTMLNSALGINGVNALTTLGSNVDLAVTPGSSLVTFNVTPNMQPSDAGKDYAENAFLTTGDFDSVSTYTLYATFRIFFDPVSASSNGRLRRRLMMRQVSSSIGTARRSADTDATTDTSITVPPQSETEVTGTSSSTGSTTAIIAAAVGAATGVAIVSALAIGLAIRRSRKRKFEEAAQSSMMSISSKSGLLAYTPEMALVTGKEEAPIWREVIRASSAVPEWSSTTFLRPVSGDLESDWASSQTITADMDYLAGISASFVQPTSGSFRGSGTITSFSATLPAASGSFHGSGTLPSFDLMSATLPTASGSFRGSGTIRSVKGSGTFSV